MILMFIVGTDFPTFLMLFHSHFMCTPHVGESSSTPLGNGPEAPPVFSRAIKMAQTLTPVFDTAHLL